jgi:hypothetical protein
VFRSVIEQQPRWLHVLQLLDTRTEHIQSSPDSDSPYSSDKTCHGNLIQDSAFLTSIRSDGREIDKLLSVVDALARANFLVSVSIVHARLPSLQAGVTNIE